MSYYFKVMLNDIFIRHIILRSISNGIKEANRQAQVELEEIYPMKHKLLKVEFHYRKK